MGKYGEVRKVIMEVLYDQEWHTIDDLRNKCEVRGITLEDRSPIYNVTHQLKKRGKIDTNGMGKYRMCKKNQEQNENTELEQEHSDIYEKQLIKSIENIEIYLEKYKKFDWINCSDMELKEARENVARLLELEEKIKNEFRRNV